MASLFDGTDRLICSALGIQRREQLNDRALRIESLSEERAIHLVNGLYERMAGNVPARIEGRSDQLWQCRRATGIADRNRSRETILEKAVANLAEQGHMPRVVQPMSRRIRDRRFAQRQPPRRRSRSPFRRYRAPDRAEMGQQHTRPRTVSGPGIWPRLFAGAAPQERARSQRPAIDACPAHRTGSRRATCVFRSR